MSAYQIGDRVRVYAPSCSFVGRRGIVTSTAPLLVHLEGEDAPLCFSVRELVREDESKRHVGGAE